MATEHKNQTRFYVKAFGFGNVYRSNENHQSTKNGKRISGLQTHGQNGLFVHAHRLSETLEAKGFGEPHDTRRFETKLYDIRKIEWKKPRTRMIFNAKR